MQAKAITKLCNRIELEQFQAKDIRRTVKTLMGFASIKKEDRDRFQNHALTDVSSRHYDRYDYLAEKRQVMAVWDEFLKEPSSQVKHNQTWCSSGQRMHNRVFFRHFMSISEQYCTIRLYNQLKVNEVQEGWT